MIPQHSPMTFASVQSLVFTPSCDAPGFGGGGGGFVVGGGEFVVGGGGFVVVGGGFVDSVLVGPVVVLHCLMGNPLTVHFCLMVALM